MNNLNNYRQSRFCNYAKYPQSSLNIEMKRFNNDYKPLQETIQRTFILSLYIFIQQPMKKVVEGTYKVKSRYQTRGVKTSFIQKKLETSTRRKQWNSLTKWIIMLNQRQSSYFTMKVISITVSRTKRMNRLWLFLFEDHKVSPTCYSFLCISIETGVMSPTSSNRVKGLIWVFI